MDALKASALFREDQYSYVLYPNKSLPRFLDKNNIDPEALAGSKLLSQLVTDENADIVTQDCMGGFHFNGNLNNVNALRAALARIAQPYESLVASEQKQIEAIYEGIFNHKSFTGRSGTFFGYEGLGSIYWHMVSKLRLAAFEVTEGCRGTRQTLRKWLGSCSITISKSMPASGRTSRPNYMAPSQPIPIPTLQAAKAPSNRA